MGYNLILEMLYLGFENIIDYRCKNHDTNSDNNNKGTRPMPWNLSSNSNDAMLKDRYNMSLEAHYCKL